MLRSVLTLCLLSIIMPCIDKHVAQKLANSAAEKDIRLSRASGALVCIGFAFMGIATNPVMLVLGLIFTALGSSFHLTLRGFMTNFVPTTSVGLLFTAIAVAQGLARLVSGPLLAEMFTWGMRAGGFWLGLPYLLSSGMCFLALIVLYQIRSGTPRPTSTIIVDGSEESEGLLSREA